MKMGQLVLEITRRCQMNCEHCFRGKAQNHDIDFKVIDNMMDYFEEINDVTFSGGEPTLNLSAIKYFFDSLRKRNKTISFFYIVSNGAANQEGLKELLLNNLDLCRDHDKCKVMVSKDIFHNKVEHSVLEDLPFYSHEKEYSEKDNSFVVECDYAKQHNIRTGNEFNPYTFFVVESDYLKKAYINYCGYIYPDCDYSYEYMDSHRDVTFDNLEDNLTYIL